MYYVKKDINNIYIECELCGNVGKYNVRYFKDITNNSCTPRIGCICSCKNYSKEIIYTKNKTDLTVDIPLCPTCKSQNIHKISTTNKVGSALAFGLFSIGHVGKTFKCDNCGMEF